MACERRVTEQRLGWNGRENENNRNESSEVMKK